MLLENKIRQHSKNSSVGVLRMSHFNLKKHNKLTWLSTLVYEELYLNDNIL